MCTFTAQELKAFEVVCRQMLMDIQERFVYRTYIYIKSDILSYAPAQGDLILYVSFTLKISFYHNVIKFIASVYSQYNQVGFLLSKFTGHV
jgi:hypothetical protein